MANPAAVAEGKSTTDRVFTMPRHTPRRALAERLPGWLGSRWAAHLFATPRSADRPETEHTFLSTGRPFRVRGLAAWRWGSGPPVFLLHGWEGRGAELGAFVDPLIARGFSVVAIDAKAHGASPGMEATLSDFADALLALEAHMGSPAAVVAHSFGTLATLLAVRRGLSARSLVLIAVPSPRERLDMFRNVLGLSDASLRAVKRIIQTRVGMSWDDVEGPALAAGIVVPSLVLHDRSDRAAPMEISERTAAALASATFRVTEGLGHRRILKDPGVVAETVSFVAAHANRASSSRARVARWKPCGDGRPSQRRQLPLFAGALR